MDYLWGKIKAVLFGSNAGTDTKVAVDSDGHLQVDLLTINVGDHASRHIAAGEDLIDGDKLDVTFTPTNYTPDAAPAEADDVNDLAAHLKGLDTALVSTVDTVVDDDNDTKIQVEESADEDKLRFDAAGSEVGIWDAVSLTMPLQPCFLVTMSSGDTDFAVNTLHTAVMDNEIFDQGGDFNTGTYTFTAPADGKYLFTVQIQFGLTIDTSAQFYYIKLVTSNGSYKTILAPKWNIDPNYHAVNLVVVADMDANDTAYVQYYQQGGAPQTDADPYDSLFSGVKVA